MAKYFKASNNGVIAIITEKTFRELKERMRLLVECKDLGLEIPKLPPVTPIFTFSKESHPSHKYMTGSQLSLSKLLTGHEVDDSACFYVPFSNKDEYKGGELASTEMLYLTNLDDVLKAFPGVMES